MTTTLNLEELDSPQAVENMSIQQKRAFAWEIIDQNTPSKGFSRKKLVPLHSAIMSILSASGSLDDLMVSIEKILTDSEPARR